MFYITNYNYFYRLHKLFKIRISYNLFWFIVVIIIQHIPDITTNNYQLNETSKNLIIFNIGTLNFDIKWKQNILHRDFQPKLLMYQKKNHVWCLLLVLNNVFNTLTIKSKQQKFRSILLITIVLKVFPPLTYISIFTIIFLSWK